MPPTTLNRPQPDRATEAAFLAIIVIGGINSIAVRFTLRELTPFWGAALRFALASLVLGAATLLVRRRRPRRENIPGILLYGVFNFALTYVFLYTGLKDVPAGTTALITALTPLLTLVLAVVQRIERFRPIGLAGSMIAAAGIGVIFSNQLSLNVPLSALLSLVVASLCFAETAVLVKRFPPGDPLVATAIAIPIGATLLAIVSLIAGEPWRLPARPESWAALTYLVVFASIVNFSLTLFVLSRWSASVAAYSYLLSPLVTIVVGGILLAETVQPAFVAGGALVLLGVYVGAFLHRPLNRRAPVVASEAVAASDGIASE